MGGLPCYQKILTDGRIGVLLDQYKNETRMTLQLLAAKGYPEDTINNQFLSNFTLLDDEVADFLHKKVQQIHDLNNKYANISEERINGDV